MKKTAIFIFFWLVFSILVPGLHAEGTTDDYSGSGTYFAATGFDLNGDGQPDFVDADNTGEIDSLAIEWPAGSGTYLESNLGGMTAPMSYYPDVTRELTDLGLDILKGDGTFEWPQLGSALEFRSILYAQTGTNALRAWYTDAIKAFTPKLFTLLEAEEHFRTALRVNPYYTDALDGLLEVYYARAEGFILIGNDYMAKAYRHKFERNPAETKSIVELELESIEAALICYDTGFREFMKLFNPEFIGIGQVHKPHLDMDPEWLFFERRFNNPNGSDLVAFEALRGQKNAVGVSSLALDENGNNIGTVQGSPTLELEITELLARANRLTRESQGDNETEYNSVDAPVKFTLPLIEGSPEWRPGTSFTLHFRADSDVEVKEFEILIEFDHEKLTPPDDVTDFDFSDSWTHAELYGPGQEYQETVLYANQMLIKLKSDSTVSGNDISLFKVPFEVKSGQTGTFYVYAAGSAGSLLTGFKDVAILYKLAAAHSHAALAKVKRLYNKADESVMEDCLNFIQKEIDTIGTWFEHIQSLLATCTTPEEINNLDQLHTSINQVASELSNLGAMRDFIRSESNVFGFPDDYVPFFNADDADTFDAIRNLVTGSGAFTPQSATGFFGIARAAESNAIQCYDQLLDTKDRIRGELYTINEQAENRLVQVCGRIDAEKNPSLDVNDPIDYDMRASTQNLACEIGQNYLLYERALANLDQANEDIKQYLEDIELEKQYLQDAVNEKNEIPGIIEEYGQLQAKLDKEIAKINAKQTMLNAYSQALSAVASGGLFGGGASAAGIIANGHAQARLERKKGDLQADKTELAAEERIKLTEIDTELFKLQETKVIEQMLNDLIVRGIAAEIAEIDVALALGQFNKFVLEHDELMAQRGRALANLGEMSFADPSFRLIQFGAMKEADTQLNFFKRWLYLLTRAVFYKWSVQDDYVIQVAGLPDIRIDDIRRIQVIGALDLGADSAPLQDTLTAAQYVETVLAFNDTGPMRSVVSPVTIDRVSSNNSARFSLREDFLRFVRTEDTWEETERVRDAFKQWLTAPERFDAEGNMVIEFDTIGHMENYDLPVNEDSGDWTNFALRSYSSLPLWNHKITNIGVGFKAFGLAFKPGVMNVSGSLEYGGVGYLKGDTDSSDDFRTYQMQQWRDLGNGQLEPIDFRTVGLTIPTSSDLEGNEAGYMVSNLKERPVSATRWRIVILASQAANVEWENIEDIYVYIYSEAYLRQ
jgi:hypothetical protein